MAGKRGRPRLPLGTYGAITVDAAAHSTRAKPIYVARARFRDSDGVTRPVTRTGPTKGKATDELRAALAARQARVQRAAVDQQTTVRDLAAQWLTQGAEGGGWSTNTTERYSLAAGQVVAELAGVRLGELSRASINTALTAIQRRHGPGSAKSAKSVLSGMCKLALLYDALETNPVRDTITISSGRKKQADALTVDQANDLCDKFRSDPDAVERYDLADLVEFMLGTGCRIGEACAARHRVIDVDAGTWEINATAVRVKGVGMTIQERPKTAAGWRVLALPSFIPVMIRRRAAELTMSTGQPVVFGAPGYHGIRDPSNTSGDLRKLLDRHGYEWVSSHTFRRTVATRLDEAGVSARQIADQIGHSNPSMTLDRYLGRNVVSADAARILDR